MSTYSAVANSEIAVGAPITNNLKTKERDNLLAIQENDATAPTIAYATLAGTVSSLGADTVGQSEVKTTYQEVSISVSLSGTGIYNFTASGGVYILGSTQRSSVSNSTGYVSLERQRTNLTTSYVSGWLLVGRDFGVTAFTAYGRLYYINSSPPYDLGFGNIPLFIFLVIDNDTQEIEAVSVSTEAPWHYNGKTNIIPSRYDKKGNAYINIIKNKKIIEIPLTQDIKNADMTDIPQPFNGDLAGKTVAVINPQNPICEELLILHNNLESVAELFHNGDIIVNNAHMVRGFDPSVKCFDINYK